MKGGFAQLEITKARKEMKKYDNALLELERKLTLISKENISLSKKAKLSIPVCIKALDQLKLLVKKDGFKSKLLIPYS